MRPVLAALIANRYARAANDDWTLRREHLIQNTRSDHPGQGRYRHTSQPAAPLSDEENCMWYRLALCATVIVLGYAMRRSLHPVEVRRPACRSSRIRNVLSPQAPDSETAQAGPSRAKPGT